MKPAEMSTAGICMGHGVVRHMRLRPTRHAFAYSAYFLLIPMRRLKSEGASTLAVNRAGCLSFFDADHGDGRGPDAGGALAWNVGSSTTGAILIDLPPSAVRVVLLSSVITVAVTL